MGSQKNWLIEQQAREQMEEERKKTKYYESTKYSGCWWEELDWDDYEAMCHTLHIDAEHTWYEGEEEEEE